MELKNKVVVITGGARVGQFVADELLGAGAKLAMTYLKDQGEVHEQAKGYPCDVTQEGSIRALLPAIEKDLGSVDGLVNMVSIFKPDPVKDVKAQSPTSHGAGSEITFEFIQQQFAINAFGNMLVSRLFAEQARKQEKKLAPIVSFIDWAVDHPYGNYDVYFAAKAALRHYLMALQTTFARRIRVVNIHPGMILEPEGFPTHNKESIIANTPTGTIGDPKQAARLVRLALELDFWIDNVRLAGGQQWRHRLKG